MRAALDGLAGIFEVRVDLRRDAFTIRFDPERLTESRIRGTIEALGFRPATGREHRDGPGHPAAVEIPESLSAALVEARGGDRPVLVEFHADWCTSCTILESRLADPRVQEVLERFVFVRVDLDVHPQAGAAFRIDAMPTLLALDGSGRELARWVGLAEADDLAERLSAVEQANRGEGCSLFGWPTP